MNPINLRASPTLARFGARWRDVLGEIVKSCSLACNYVILHSFRGVPLAHNRSNPKVRPGQTMERTQVLI